jgi:hypothetical protein
MTKTKREYSPDSLAGGMDIFLSEAKRRRYTVRNDRDNKREGIMMTSSVASNSSPLELKCSILLTRREIESNTFALWDGADLRDYREQAIAFHRAKFEVHFYDKCQDRVLCTLGEPSYFTENRSGELFQFDGKVSFQKNGVSSTHYPVDNPLNNLFFMLGCVNKEAWGEHSNRLQSSGYQLGYLERATKFKMPKESIKDLSLRQKYEASISYLFDALKVPLPQIRSYIAER